MTATTTSHRISILVVASSAIAASAPAQVPIRASSPRPPIRDQVQHAPDRSAAPSDSTAGPRETSPRRPRLLLTTDSLEIDPAIVTLVDWDMSARQQLEGRQEQYFAFRCLPGGRLSNRVRGTRTYSLGSRLCAAAVHAGVITPLDGGSFAVRVLAPDGRGFEGTSHHGVTTTGSERYELAEDGAAERFTFVDPPRSMLVRVEPLPVVEVESAAVEVIEWDRRASAWDARTARPIAVRCPPGGHLHPVWGTDAYSTRSSICAAAVHAGRLNAVDGGVVVFEIGPSFRSFVGSLRQGVKSEHEFYEGGPSFRFRDDRLVTRPGRREPSRPAASP